MADEVGVNPGESEEVEGKGGTMMNIVMVMLLLILLVAESYGAFVLVKLNYAKVNQMLTFEESTPEPGTYSFQKLTINTNDEQARFLVFSMTFELYEQSDEQLMLDNEPIIKDALNRLIARRSAKELRSIDMQSQLKQEIGIMVNEILQKNAVTSIYFSEFLVQ